MGQELTQQNNKIGLKVFLIIVFDLVFAVPLFFISALLFSDIGRGALLEFVIAIILFSISIFAATVLVKILKTIQSPEAGAISKRVFIVFFAFFVLSILFGKLSYAQLAYPFLAYFITKAFLSKH
ncbi:MAG: hypothetical protein Q8Q06_04670 [bacterium]|nr:hypothetical protein [bacterium]